MLLKGLPASGKSTFAKQLVDKFGWKRVNKDDLRAMMDNSKWSKSNEKFVKDMRDYLILLALDEGKNVVVDDTNLDDSHFKRISWIVKQRFGDKVIVTEDDSFLKVPVAECIKRDLKRQNSVGKDVIMRMYNQYVKPKLEQYVPNTDLKKAILCDIDGTIAKMGKRSPYDWEKVGIDRVNEPILEILSRFVGYQHEIIMLSGRDGSCREATENWLIDNNVPFDQLLMREAGDSRKDAIVKEELFNQHVKDKYNVQFVLDDRNQVVEMWRDKGLTCLQVAEGDF